MRQDRVHLGHITQEESVVSNWLLTEADTPELRDAAFQRVARAWGLVDRSGTGTETIQGIDYTVASAREYADA